jgi:hypothetical protein
MLRIEIAKLVIKEPERLLLAICPIDIMVGGGILGKSEAPTDYSHIPGIQQLVDEACDDGYVCAGGIFGPRP